MVDLDRLERLLIAAARERRPLTYGQILAFFERRVTRITVGALCRDLGQVGRRLEKRGAPDLACLVVRKSDGLPGEGWFTAARAELGYDGPSEGEAARAFVTSAQASAFAWAARVAAILLVCLAPARAAPVTLNGITFSDEMGGLTLRAGAGTGTPDDPFVLQEDITDDGPAVLVIRGLGKGMTGERLDRVQQVGFSLRKVVSNRTHRRWQTFELELRETLERPSSYEDGLSFGQATPDRRPITADRFGRVVERDEPLDAIEFSDGTVDPGQTVTVDLIITDYTPRYEFYLLQRRDSPTSELRSPLGQARLAKR